jgi:DNA polymerase III epsilon subunit-like protein
MILDTETSGLPEKGPGFGKVYPTWDTMKYKGARLLQLAYSLYQMDGTLVREVNMYVRPSDFTISAESTKIHGITPEFAQKNGRPVQVVLRELERDLASVYMVIGHNIAFDRLIVQSEAWRNGMNEFALMLDQIPWGCTMRAGMAICGDGKKWPKLVDLYRELFGEEFGGAHNAMEDVRATARCWAQLRVRRLML